MTIATVTEGISEYQVFKHLLSKYLKDIEPEINPMRPIMTANEKKQADGSSGGWNEILKYCENEEELKSIFIENDYLLLQIDTDMSEISPYDVPKTGKTDEQLYDAVKDRLLRDMPEAIKEKYGERIIFAICIHTTECWLLPVFCTDVHKCSTNNCLNHLNRVLGKKNLDQISTTGDKNDHKSKEAYRAIFQELKKKKEIDECCQHNYGFTKFIEQLNTISSKPE